MAGVSQYEDLDTWQLRVQLRDEIFRLTESGPAARNLQFRDQIRDAARSGPRNIAEGFGRFRPREFAYLVRIARALVVETKNRLQDAQTRGYFADGTIEGLLTLTGRCIGATTNLLAYLESCGDKAPTGWDFNASKTNESQRWERTSSPQRRPKSRRRKPKA